MLGHPGESIQDQTHCFDSAYAYLHIAHVVDSCVFSVLRPHGDGLLVAGLFFTDYPPSWEKIPSVEDLGLCDPPGEPGWLSW